MKCKYLGLLSIWGKSIKFLSYKIYNITGHMNFSSVVALLKNSLNWWHSSINRHILRSHSYSRTAAMTQLFTDLTENYINIPLNTKYIPNSIATFPTSPQMLMATSMLPDIKGSIMGASWNGKTRWS